MDGFAIIGTSQSSNQGGYFLRGGRKAEIELIEPKTIENAGMVLHGRIQNGVVVLDGNPALPEGTPPVKAFVFVFALLAAFCAK